jgi:hypothetical protein
MMNTALAMMQVGDLMNREELVAATTNYALAYNWRDVLFVLTRGESFDVFAYVDVEQELFEHILDSQDTGYSLARVISAIVKHGEDIAKCHLAEDDMYFRGWCPEYQEWGLTRDVRQALNIVKAKDRMNPIRYNVVNGAGHVSSQMQYVASYITHTERYECVVKDQRGLTKVVTEVTRQYRPDVVKDNTIRVGYGERLIEAKPLGFIIDLNRPCSFSPGRYGIAPVKYIGVHDRLQWIKTICDANGDIVEKLYL